ncbi:MAG: transglycosylase domain-containing protein [Gemmatimonadetes bacterium]|nr:transglycosylase domain-containing protein [Gemmatimonadota bacterium]
MADAKRRKAGLTTLGLAALAAVWLFGVWPPPVWWRDHWPRETAMMRFWADGRIRPSALKDISPLLQRMVILGEDSRFRTHHGLDFAEVADALRLERGVGVWGTAKTVWRRRDRLRGASTITQQLAKNLYLSPSRNPLRKVKEAVTAVRLEVALPKDRILELYLNVVELGPGLWGADAASREYYGVPASQLTEEQAASLAATLPHPRTSNPLHRPGRMLARRGLILARYHGADVYIPQLEDVDIDSLLLLPITPPIIPPVIESVPQVPMDTAPRDTASPRKRSG